MATAKKPVTATQAKKASKVKSAAAKATNLVTVEKKSTAIAVKPKKTAAITPVKLAKTDLVAQYQAHKQDTGSTAVQIALLSQQIGELQKHLKKHTHDHDSRRGLLIMVGKRRKLLNYLGRTDEPSYQKLIVDLKLRK